MLTAFQGGSFTFPCRDETVYWALINIVTRNRKSQRQKPLSPDWVGTFLGEPPGSLREARTHWALNVQPSVPWAGTPQPML